MFCKWCGKPLTAKQRQCSACGHKVDSPNACGGFAGIAATLPPAPTPRLEEPADRAVTPAATTPAASATPATPAAGTPARRRRKKSPYPSWLPVAIGGAVLVIAVTLLLLWLLVWRNGSGSGSGSGGRDSSEGEEVYGVTEDVQPDGIVDRPFLPGLGGESPSPSPSEDAEGGGLLEAMREAAKETVAEAEKTAQSMAEDFSDALWKN